MFFVFVIKLFLRDLCALCGEKNVLPENGRFYLTGNFSPPNEEIFSDNVEMFYDDRDTFSDAIETFYDDREMFSGNREMFYDDRETFSDAVETFYDNIEIFFDPNLISRSQPGQAATKKGLACLEIPNSKFQIPNKAVSFGPVF
jgi:hypothetical protein